MPKILDNNNDNAKLGDYLNRHIPDADIFRIVSAYFSVNGYNHLADALDQNPKQRVKFLFGDPTSVDEVTPDKQQPITARIKEDGIDITSTLTQSTTAERCAEWVKSKNVRVRTIAKSNFLHGKMYHTENTGDTAKNAATVGSSNFTQRGLGASANPNIELNVAVDNEQTHTALKQWFDALWENKELAKDAKQELLAALERRYKPYTPEFIYYRTLFVLFGEEINKRIDDNKNLSASKFTETQIWQKLYDFQKDAVGTILTRLQNHGGCILADSVGLGKTYTALAVIKYFELYNDNKRVLVLCPKRLEKNWRIYQHSSGNMHNPFDKDPFYYYLLAHTDLTRESGKSGDIDLENFPWDSFGLVVIDESHNFRNISKTRKDEHGKIIISGRYHQLMEKALKANPGVKVLLLSATPVNTSLIDLQNQIYLITKQKNDAFAGTLGIKNISNTIKEAQNKFKEWAEQKKSKEDLLSEFNGNFIRLLSGVTIARGRKHITKFHKEDMERHGDFPTRAKPENFYSPTDAERELSYEEMHDLITKAKFRIYCPSAYVREQTPAHESLENEKRKYHFNQANREKCLIAMMRVIFLKRLESSAKALYLTLDRTIQKIDMLIEKINKFLKHQNNSEILPEDFTSFDEFEDDEDFFVGNKLKMPYDPHDLDAKRWLSHIQEDKAFLVEARDLIAKITPNRDAKLAKLRELIRAKAANKNNRKLLVFAAYADTAVYLYNQTKDLAKELKIKIAKVDGESTPTRFNSTLTNFSPISRGRQTTGDEIDILIATDCISEGQNLQDCDTVLNYDIHWNPVRLIQRFGRIDRIGSKNKTINMINFWPTKDMDLYLNLVDRVHARMALVDTVTTGSDNPLVEEAEAAARRENSFRDEQIKNMKEEIIDLDDLPESFNLSDFTWDDFLTQLTHYLQENRKKLENVPVGVHAVVDAPAKANQKEEINPGVIFFFRQNDAGKVGKNPTHPYYFVQAEENGHIRRGYTHAMPILRLFEALAAEKTSHDRALCDIFSHSIKTADSKAVYDNMANKAVHHIGKTFVDIAKKSLGNFGTLIDTDAIYPKKSQHPSFKNLTLITWLVILRRHHK